MRNALTRKIIIALVFICLSLISLRVPNVFAASTTIGPAPQNGSFDKPFTVNMVIDGHGNKFNAAEAAVSIPSNLKVTNLTLGDCNFSFLRTPSIQNPSFAGVIISTYSTKCSAYTMTLAPIAKGSAKITLSKASVKRYGDAAEILSSTNTGSYILTGIVKVTTSPTLKNTSQAGLYTLYLQVTTNTTAVPNAKVTLKAVSTKNNQQTITDNTGTAHFSNLQAGVYDAVVTKEDNKVGETIVNVSGSNHVLTLGVNLATQKTNPLINKGSFITSLLANPLYLIGALVIGVLIGVVIALLIIKLLSKGKN